MKENERKYLRQQRQKRVAEIVEMGSAGDWISRGYDILSCLMQLVNITVTIFYTFDKMELLYGKTLLLIESVTVAFFAVDYVLRICTARVAYPCQSGFRAVCKYAFSLTGIVDLLSFLP